MSSDPKANQRGGSDDARRFNETLRNLLRTPPKPHRPESERNRKKRRTAAKKDTRHE